MDGKYEKHMDLTPGRILEKKINSWIAKIRVSGFSPEIESDLEIILSQAFPRDTLEEMAANPKEVLVIYEILGNELEKLDIDDQDRLKNLLDDVEIDLKEIRAREN